MQITVGPVKSTASRQERRDELCWQLRQSLNRPVWSRCYGFWAIGMHSEGLMEFDEATQAAVTAF